MFSLTRYVFTYVSEIQREFVSGIVSTYSDFKRTFCQNVISRDFVVSLWRFHPRKPHIKELLSVVQEPCVFQYLTCYHYNAVRAYACWLLNNVFTTMTVRFGRFKALTINTKHQKDYKHTFKKGKLLKIFWYEMMTARRTTVLRQFCDKF